MQSLTADLDRSSRNCNRTIPAYREAGAVVLRVSELSNQASGTGGSRGRNIGEIIQQAVVSALRYIDHRATEAGSCKVAAAGAIARGSTRSGSASRSGFEPWRGYDGSSNRCKSQPHCTAQFVLLETCLSLVFVAIKGINMIGMLPTVLQYCIPLVAAGLWGAAGVSSFNSDFWKNRDVRRKLTVL